MGGTFSLEPRLEKVDRAHAYRTGNHSGARYEWADFAARETLVVYSRLDPLKRPFRKACEGAFVCYKRKAVNGIIAYREAL